MGIYFFIFSTTWGWDKMYDHNTEKNVQFIEIQVKLSPSDKM